MVSETSGNAPLIYYGPLEKPVSCMISEEQMALGDFCQRLGSSSNCTGEPCIVEATRREARLLMSLMLSNVTSDVEDDSADGISYDRLSSADNLLSFSEVTSGSRRGLFTFTCPSLSLENPSEPTSHLQRDVNRKEFVSLQSSNNTKEKSPPPALLLGRPLKVDDRDALRLSADAMARNILESFEKAMDWRIHAWIYSVSKQLVRKERTMVEAGATVEEVKTLLDSPEASLLVLLRKIAEEHQIKVETTNTAFRVLPQRVEKGSDVDAAATKTETARRSEKGARQLKRNGSSKSTNLYQKDELDYSYTVIHQLQFSCDVQLQTPAGFSEITISVPGTIEGAFQSSELDPTAELKSVYVNLDTNILASMVEKGCRAIVRSSVEKAMTQPEDSEEFNEDAAEPYEVPAAIALPSREESFTLLSPLTYFNMDPAMVTPRNIFADESMYTTPSSKVLFPIPDDFDKKTDKPRRISPQTSLHDFFNSTDDLSSTTPLKRSSPTYAADDGGNTMSVKRRLPLISPLASNESKQFLEVSDNGPSLPMLVEVANAFRLTNAH